METRFPLEFTVRCCKRIFTFGYQAFGKAPGACIAMLPERAGRMREQDFQRVAGTAI